MAYIEERKTKKGISRVVRFRLGGQEVKIFLDSAYSRRDAEDAKSAVEGFLRAKKLEEPLDRKTRLYFESASPDLLKRFVALGFNPARGASKVVDVWQTFQAAKSSTVGSLGAKARLRSVSRLLSGGDSFRRTDSGSDSRVSRRTNETIRPNDGRQHDRRFANVRRLERRARIRCEESVLGGRPRFDFEQSARLSGSSRLGGADFRRLSVAKLADALRALAVRRVASTGTDVFDPRFGEVGRRAFDCFRSQNGALQK